MFRSFIKNGLLSFLFSGFLLLSGCSKTETTVIIFHTNDSHANIDNFPVLAFLVNQERQANEHVFLVSAGDIFSGNPMVDYFDPPGYPKIDLMNRVGYNLNTIGNHEFDYGIEILKERMDQADFPFILANLNTEGSGLPQPEPYCLMHAGKRTIGFLGLVQLNNRGIPSAHPDNLKGIEFYPPIEKAGEFDFLTLKSDAVIALTHHGFVSDTLMAWNYPWLDVIIGGHSHTVTMNPRTWNDVLITQAGANLEYIGRVSLIFRGRELVEKKAEIISLSSIDGRDEELAGLVEEYNDNPVLNRVIGRLLTPLEGKPDLGGFMTDVYRKYGKYDLAFHNYGGIRVNRLEGEIRVSDIFRMDPFKNELVSLELSYSELQGLITNSLTARNRPSIQISGGTMEVHLTNDGLLNEVKIFDSQGNELIDDTGYIVGVPSYIASAFDFERRDPGTGSGITTAQVIIDHISAVYDIEFTRTTRSRVIREQEELLQVFH